MRASEFFVEPGLIFDGLPSGFLVTHLNTGMFIWTGGQLTVSEAKDRLILAAERRERWLNLPRSFR